MGRRLLALVAIFAIFIAKDHQCNGLRPLERILEVENRVSNAVSLVDALMKFGGVLTSRAGSRMSSTSVSEPEPRGPILSILRLVDHFIARRIDPLLSFYRAIQKIFSPFRDGIKSGILDGLRSLNQLIVDIIRRVLSMRPKPIANAAKALLSIPKSIASNIADKAKQGIKERQGPIRRFLSTFIYPIITGVISQAVVNALTKTVLKHPFENFHPLQDLVSKVKKRLHPLQNPTVVPAALKGRLVLAFLRLFRPRLWLPRIFHLLRRRSPRALVMALIFYFQWRIARNLASAIESFKNIIRTLIRIIINIRKNLAKLNPINIFKRFLGKLLGFFGVGGGGLSKPISRIVRLAGTLSGFGSLLNRLPKLTGNLGAIIKDFVLIAIRVIRRFIPI